MGKTLKLAYSGPGAADAAEGHRPAWRLYADRRVVRAARSGRGEPWLVSLCGGRGRPADGEQTAVDELVIGEYDRKLTADIAQDLAELVVAPCRSRPNFGGGMMYDLAPVFGTEVLAGLDPRLPADFRRAMAWAVERFSG
jgi:hypothetical protein